jgi:hypothetical protein
VRRPMSRRAVVVGGEGFGAGQLGPSLSAKSVYAHFNRGEQRHHVIRAQAVCVFLFKLLHSVNFTSASAHLPS